MSENVLQREFVAKIFDSKQYDIDPRLRGVRTRGNLIRAVVNAEMFGCSIKGPNLTEDDAYIARNWRFLFPVENAPTAVDYTEFGLTPEETSEDRQIAKYESEALFDSAIDDSADQITKSLFKHVGGYVAEEVHKKDRPFFAGLELRVAPSEDHTSELAVGSIQLVYPVELLHSVDIMRRSNARLKSKGRQPHRWMEKAAKPGDLNRVKVANAMALGAFWAKLEQERTMNADGGINNQ